MKKFFMFGIIAFGLVLFLANVDTCKKGANNLLTSPLLECNRANNAFCSSVSTIDDEIKARMKYSWKDNNPVPIEDLRYIKLTHWDFNKEVQEGELVVHKERVDDVIGIFRDLFEDRLPIHKMKLIDEYKANDTSSMEDNNSSAFCSRPIKGTNRFSQHSYGVAVDINPLFNPCVTYEGKEKKEVVEPIDGEKYLANRRTNEYLPGMIEEGGPYYKAFVSRGWTWGGHWNSLKDYHHFEKPLEQK